LRRTNNYSNLVYLHDLLESIIEHDTAFIITILQAHVKDEWVRKITKVVYSNKEELLPNRKRIDIFYKVMSFKKNICLGFEIKTGNEVDEKQLREEIEGLKSVEGCDESFLVLVAQEDPKYNIPYYFIPLFAFNKKINVVIELLDKFVKNLGNISSPP